MTPDDDEITDDLYLIEILLRYCQPKDEQYKLAEPQPADWL